MPDLLSIEVKLDEEAFMRNLRREGTPARVHHMELYLDSEVSQEVATRFRLWDDIDPNKPYADWDREIALKRFLGYDYVTCGLDGYDWPLYHDVVDDTAENKRASGRHFVNLHAGPITNWEQFEKYPWPDPDRCATESLEYLEKNLPDDMCVIGGLTAHFAELLSWLMGYETLCYALYDQRDLVTAIRDRLESLECRYVERVLQFDRVKAIWGSDDMGFRTGTLISPEDMREFVLRGHRKVAKQTHDAGRIYLLHSCGKLDAIWPDLLDDVKVDAKHSFEDIIESVIDHKRRTGDRMSLIGGVDMDLMCRGDEKTIRARVREILDACMPGGGYCLGTGNSVANYIPLDNYLIMLDEGRKYSA
jgi:uroporphyrinogen decarboxylase